MHEIDFLAVGDGDRSGDAIAMRFTRPDTGELAHVIIDGGFQDDGDDMVELFTRHYGTDQVDLVFLTHPDGDHIGGLGTVIRDLDVGVLAVHRPARHGFPSMRAAKAVEDLVQLAGSRGVAIHEPFAGDGAFGGALVVAGPDRDYYREMLVEQDKIERSVGKAAATATSGGALAEAIRRAGQRFLAALPVEIPFGDACGTNPRNNSAVILDLNLEQDGKRFLFTSDAGVPGLNRALDFLDASGRNPQQIGFVQIPHHGSRRNLDTPTLDRMLGPTGQVQDRTAYVSVSGQAIKHPAPRIVNGFMHRGYEVFSTAGTSVCHSSPDSPPRAGYGPAPALQPMVVPEEDD